MAKKSAAQLKAKRASTFETESLPPIEETWEKIKQLYTTTLEVNVQLAERIDNLLNLRDLAFKMLGEDYMWRLSEKERIGLFKQLQEVSIKAYKDMLKIAESWTIDQFTVEDMADWFEGLVPKSAEIKTEIDLLEGAVIFLSVKPYGERMAAMHQQMLDEKKMREEA